MHKNEVDLVKIGRVGVMKSDLIPLLHHELLQGQILDIDGSYLRIQEKTPLESKELFAIVCMCIL